MPSEQVAIHDNQPVLITSQFGLRVREDTAFTNKKGEEKPAIRRRALKLLEKLQEPLRKFLEPDESILYIARGQRMPSGFAQFFLGWHSYYLSPSILVLTNRRFLHLLVARNGTWRRGLRCAPWSAVETAKVKGLLSPKLHMKFRDGTKEVYWRIRNDDGRKIGVLASELTAATGSAASAGTAMVSLCPACRTPLQRELYECPQCRLMFKDPTTLVQRALLIPGGAFFYSGHIGIGLAHAAVDLIMLAELIISAFVVAGVMPSPSSSGAAPGAKPEALTVLVLFAALLLLHKWITIRIAKGLIRDFIPAK